MLGPVIEHYGEEMERELQKKKQLEQDWRNFHQDKMQYALKSYGCFWDSSYSTLEQKELLVEYARKFHYKLIIVQTSYDFGFSKMKSLAEDGQLQVEILKIGNLKLSDWLQEHDFHQSIFVLTNVPYLDNEFLKLCAYLAEQREILNCSVIILSQINGFSFSWYFVVRYLGITTDHSLTTKAQQELRDFSFLIDPSLTEELNDQNATSEIYWKDIIQPEISYDEPEEKTQELLTLEKERFREQKKRRLRLQSAPYYHLLSNLPESSRISDLPNELLEQVALFTAGAKQ